MQPLGRLEKLDLRTFWKKESTEFTPWLAQSENIQLLSETIGIQLEVQRTEEAIGPFSADILCKDIMNDHFVLIENQLERTDHTHLGQLMTYAAGLNAVTIIWIAQRFTEEHREALDWLNRITDESFNFFGIEIELYRIGDSVAAPMFHMVSKPNNWAKQTRKVATNSEPTETKKLQYEYWVAFNEHMEQKKSFLKMHSPQARHWSTTALGRSNFHLSSNINSRENTLTIWFVIQGLNAKANYDKLFEQCHKISLEQIHKDLHWDRLDAKKLCYVQLKTSADFTDKSDHQRQFEWLKLYMEKFAIFFKPFIKAI